tara:strand:+ start:300 stop:656 length:357 start_codon:yes stop_codon:yes gene_type:complete
MKVYFNNSCKICKAEIDIYKKEKIKDINWVDISNNRAAELETNKNDKQLLRRLHVEKNGRIFSGAKAFLLIWKNIPKYKFLYSILSLPIIFQIFSIFYEIIAFFLYLKNIKQIKLNLK